MQAVCSSCELATELQVLTTASLLHSCSTRQCTARLVISLPCPRDV